MDTFKGEINEFVDWLNGQNELTEAQETEGKAASGQSIRRLIQKHLKRPFITFEDPEENMIYFFSSEEAKQLWLSHRYEDNNDAFQNLVLYSMAKPSAYKIELNNEFLDNIQRYVSAGDDSQVALMMAYTWDVKFGDESETDNLLVTYEITNPSGKVRKTAESKNYGDRLNMGNPLNLYEYLESGVNQVDILFSAQRTGAKKSMRIFITMVEFNVTSSFRFYNRVENADTFDLPVVLERNILNQTANIYVNIDGQMASINGSAAGLPYTVNAGVTGTVHLSIANPVDLETGLRRYTGSTTRENISHVMQVWAETTVGGTTFRSNLLYYTFEVKADLPLSNKFINVGNSYTTAILSSYPLGTLTIYGTQYNPITLPWGYYTDSVSYDTAVTIDWKIEQDGTETLIASLKGETGIKPSDLTFIPNTNSVTKDMYLKAYHGEDLLISIPLVVVAGTSAVVAPSGMNIELNAYQKNNNTEDKNEWKTTGVVMDAVLSSAIKYDTLSGWNNHALRVSGPSEYATLAYNVFDESNNNEIQSVGRTIEFEFESERVDNDNDVIMLIGDDSVGPNGERFARIEVTPNSATLYANGNIENPSPMVIKTNFKANERVKLAFILNPASATADNGLIYIVTNGILERASQGGSSFTLANGSIKIGGSNSGIKFYNLRVYNHAISYTAAYNNFIFDSDNKNAIIANNNIMKNGVIDYDLCCAKIDTILIEGNLDALLSGDTDKDQSTTNATISRSCPYDSTKNFTVENAQIRKHGQSTLSYPITSMKFWLNKKFNPSNANDIPRFTCEGQADLGLAKNRYKMKDDSIPANKFVLQANYADSSGVHNGGLERLIQDTWYRARVNNKYVLRTEPQLFTSLSESEKGDYNMQHVWHDGIERDFPYELRVAPDSFPCVVFYKNGEGERTYLGQYVFMEDKKSDFNYGERSIYKADPSDPFCLKTINKSSDTNENKIWDNGNVLRIEVLDINNIFTSYINWVKDGLAFDADIPEVVNETTDPETGIVTRTTIPRHYNWEGFFEMIYPDPDDIEGNSANGTDKFGANSKFRRTAQPFLDWVKWLTDTRNNYNVATEWWAAGTYSTAQEAFQATAAAHLDLYKMAAYYIFMLRFGLTDSGERNVQIKTYDGTHFHYEPWDMDIAMGNRNDGGIAFAPPIDRNTRLGNGFAISGRGSVVGGTPQTSNWLWDALEAWTEWSSVIVPDVAKALYAAGLTYENCAAMFDEEYADKWSELLYNESGYYKYVRRGGGSQMYLNWLQGARMLHRHWWLSSSMNYYDAKWGVGSFNDSRIDLFAGHAGVENSEEFVTIYPSSQTFFKMMVNQTNNLGTLAATRQLPARFNVGPETFQPKVPTYIYGANFIEKLDLSVIASTLARVVLGGSHDKTLGAPIKELNLGVPVTQVDADTYTGGLNIADPGNIETTVGEGENKVYALTNLQMLNIRGQLGLGSETGNFYTTFSMLRDTIDNRGDLASVKNLYAMGSGIVNFQSSNQGNRFEHLELPAGLYSLDLNNTTWEDISFWTTVANGSSATFSRYKVNNNASLFVPTGITEMRLNGTTGHTRNSKNLVMAWINGIIAELGQNPTDAQIETALGAKTLIMDDINWSSANLGGDAYLMTYDELALIAKIGTRQLKGYVMLATGQTALTSQQLTQLTQWFGNDIFTYTSSGLIVDYNLDQTIISVSGEITLDANQEIHLKEGHTAILNATRFHLDTSVPNVTWTIREKILDGNSNPIETIAGETVRSCSLDTHNPRQILLTAQNSTEGAYDIFVHSSLGNAEITVHIDPTDYPVLAIDNTNNTARENGEALCLYGGGISDNFSVVVVSAAPDAVGVQGVSWTIELADGTLINPDLVNNPSEYKMVNNSNVLKYKKGTGARDINLAAGLAGNDETIYNYTLKATVNLGGKTEVLTKSIIVMNDLSPIVSADGSNLYSALLASYSAQYDGATTEQFYRSTLLALTGTLDFSSYPNIGRVATSTNKSIFYYLHNITGIILDGCSLLTDTFTNGNVVINQMDFSHMPALRVLSLNGCSGLSADIDLTANINIISVDVRNTSLNVILPDDTTVETLRLGSPTKFELTRASRLSDENVSIVDGSNITTIDIEDSGNRNSYRIFGKIK